MEKSIKEVSATKVEQPGFDRSRSGQVDCVLTVLTRLDLRLAAR